jgi:hypothetical protein
VQTIQFYARFAILKLGLALRATLLADGSRDGLVEFVSSLTFRPSTLATADGTRRSSEIEANSTSDPPSANSPRTWRAAFNASVDFPLPPGPVNVTCRRK